MSKLEIYTDGACSGNHVLGAHRRAGIGIVMVDNEEVVWDHSEDVTDIISPVVTNNRAELYAIMLALRTFLEECEGYDSLFIYTDSKYAVDVFGVWLKDWRRNGRDYKNRDLIDAIDRLLVQANRKFTASLVHVRGHSTNVFNNMADKLAVSGTRSSSYIS